MRLLNSWPRQLHPRYGSLPGRRLPPFMGRTAYPHMSDVQEYSKRLEQALARAMRPKAIGEQDKQLKERFSAVLQAQRISTGRVETYVNHLKIIAQTLPRLIGSERGLGRSEAGLLPRRCLAARPFRHASRNGGMSNQDNRRGCEEEGADCLPEHWIPGRHPNIEDEVGLFVDAAREARVNVILGEGLGVLREEQSGGSSDVRREYRATAEDSPLR